MLLAFGVGVKCDSFLSDSCYDSIEDKVNQYVAEVNDGDQSDDNYEWIAAKLMAAEDVSDESPKFHMNINQIMDFWDAKQSDREKLLRRSKPEVIIPDNFDARNDPMKDAVVMKINQLLDKFMANFVKFFDNFKKLINAYLSGNNPMIKRFLKEAIVTYQFFDSVTTKLNAIIERFMSSN